MEASTENRRPKLSLQTRTMPRSITRATKMMNPADPRDPTSFNTLSNVYNTVIERSTPVQETPLTAINVKRPLKLMTDPASLKNNQSRIATPFTANLPETPISANPMSPAQQNVSMIFPSTMTATPPMSAGASETGGRVFTFNPADLQNQAVPSSPAQARRKAIYSAFGPKAPYTRIKGLRGILRNSPLPPSSAISPISPRRQSLRLQEKAARRVGYLSPLEQTITTETYTRSHIDLLVDEASPYSPNPAAADSDMVLDITMAYTGDETRDGGQTPGPFEEMRRRMAGMATESPVLSPRAGNGVGKRKRKEKKRRWVWTIGNQEETAEDGGAILAVKAAAVATSASRSAAPPDLMTTVSSTYEEAITPRISHPQPRLKSTTPEPRLKSTTPEPRLKSTTPEPLTALHDPAPEKFVATRASTGPIHISVEQVDTSLELSTTEPSLDVEMSEAESSVLSSRATTPFSESGLEMITPVVKRPGAMMFSSPARRAIERQTSVSSDMIDPQTGTRRDTPIPEDLVATNHNQ